MLGYRTPNLSFYPPSVILDVAIFNILALNHSSVSLEEFQAF